MDVPANDNQPGGHPVLTFRDKVYLYYRDTKLLPGSAELLATHYVSALRRAESFEADQGPILPGCDEFGAEPSPREIVTAHAHSMLSRLKVKMRQAMIEAGVAAAELEIRSPDHDGYGRRYKLHRC
ncbi:hypothetical protein O9X98_04720 [Agrobacterium salinitolerans]|nr:hypothetical protein [Agrobacterium salinitolerans]